MRRLRAELANKDAIITGFESDRVTYQGNNAKKSSTSCFRLIRLLTMCVADAINKAKEFAANVGTTD